MSQAVLPIAARIIEKCGGVAATAKLAERTEVSVYRWTWPKEKGGTGGLVPTEAQQKIMAAAQRGEVQLSPADFFDLPDHPEAA